MYFNDKLLKKLISGQIDIICHHNADPDVICAAYSLSEMMNQINPNLEVKIIYPDTISKLTKNIVNFFNITNLENFSGKLPDTFIILDSGSLSQLEHLSKVIRESNSNKIFIDHHSWNNEIDSIATLYFNDEQAASTCEIIYDLYNKLGTNVSQKIAQVLLTGIMFDSKHFLIGTSKTFRIVSELINCGALINISREILIGKLSPSEKIARLKACNRMEIYREGSWIIVVSKVNSFQSSAARGIISLGADVAIITGDKQGRFKVSIRSSDDFLEKTKINLGKEIINLSAQFNGSGGGHSTSAGFNGEGSPENFSTKLVELIFDRIKSFNIQ